MYMMSSARFELSLSIVTVIEQETHICKNILRKCKGIVEVCFCVGVCMLI